MEFGLFRIFLVVLRWFDISSNDSYYLFSAFVVWVLR